MDHFHETTPPTKLKSAVMGEQSTKKKLGQTASKMTTTVKPTFNYTTSDLTLVTTTKFDGMPDQVVSKVINLEEAAIRETLIKLGWTPPTNQ